MTPAYETKFGSFLRNNLAPGKGAMDAASLRAASGFYSFALSDYALLAAPARLFRAFFATEHDDPQKQDRQHRTDQTNVSAI
jgi:hypothetical protein